MVTLKHCCHIVAQLNVLVAARPADRRSKEEEGVLSSAVLKERAREQQDTRVRTCHTCHACHACNYSCTHASQPGIQL